MYGMRRISLMQSIVFQSSDNFPISAKTYIGFSQKKTTSRSLEIYV